MKSRQEQVTAQPARSTIRTIFKTNPATGVSPFRIYLLRIFYLLVIVLLGSEVWKEIFTHQGPWQPLPAVAFSFWAAFAALAMLGLLHPLKMIPLLLMQFSYKLIWLVIVAWPLWQVNQLDGFSAELAKTNLTGVLIDLVVIPWPYVVKNYLVVNRKK